MSRRDDRGQFAKAPSKKMFLGGWLASLASFGLVWASVLALWANFSSFRSCDINSNGLYLADCGKKGINIGDLILLGLFLLAVAMAFSLSTHTYRMTRRMIKR